MNLADAISGLWTYWLIIALMMVGLYIVIARDNLVKKVMGLNIFQGAAILFYVSMAKVAGGTARRSCRRTRLTARATAGTAQARSSTRIRSPTC